MRVGRVVLSWVPSLAVGVTMAAAAELSAVLLLYSGPGLLRALSLILAVEAGSVALGLWLSAGVADARVVESVRRRWLFTLTVLSAATITAVTWSFVGGFSDSRLGQGLGLAVLGGLPLYAGGALTGLLAKPQAGLTPPPGSRRPQPGVLVVVGVALGFLLVGTLLRTPARPGSILLGCIVVLSGGALVHGRFLLPLEPEFQEPEPEEIESGEPEPREDRQAAGTEPEPRASGAEELPL